VSLRAGVPLGAAVTLALLCLASIISVASAAETSMRVLTFIEVRSDAVERAAEMLRRYARALRKTGGEVELLQESGRPERFALIETASREPDQSQPESPARALWAELEPLLVAPPDRRTHQELPDSGPGSLPATGAAVFVVAHLDIGGPARQDATAALRRLVSAARASDGNLGMLAWQQLDRSNHFNLIAAWRDPGARAAFSAGAAARAFRTSVAPVIGSPYDERLYRRID
jgi:quinol monooxygenase YgiN